MAGFSLLNVTSRGGRGRPAHPVEHEFYAEEIFGSNGALLGMVEFELNGTGIDVVITPEGGRSKVTNLAGKTAPRGRKPAAKPAAAPKAASKPKARKTRSTVKKATRPVGRPRGKAAVNTVKRGPGRPKGSKNKPRTAPPRSRRGKGIQVFA